MVSVKGDRTVELKNKSARIYPNCEKQLEFTLKFNDKLFNYKITIATVNSFWLSFLIEEQLLIFLTSQRRTTFRLFLP